MIGPSNKHDYNSLLLKTTYTINILSSLLKYIHSEMCRKRHFKVIAVTTVTVFNHFYNRSAGPFQLSLFPPTSDSFLNFTYSISKLVNFFFH